MNAAVTDLDQDSQKSAAMLEQTAASGQMLRNEASNLVQVVSVFKLSAESGATELQANPINATASMWDVDEDPQFDTMRRA